MKELIPYRYDFMNCLYLSITNILNYKNIKNPDAIWKQCGLSYIKYPWYLFGELQGNFNTVEEELKWIHNIELSRNEYIEAERFLNEVYSLLDSKEPVVVYVDSYHLPNDMFYNKRHINHTIILTDYDKETFSYVDAPYYYKGKVTKEALIQATGSDYGRMIPKKFELFTISVDKFTEPNPEDYLTVIQKNMQALKGEVPIINPNTSDGFHELRGVNSIICLNKDINNLLDKDIEVNMFYELYSSITEISNNHHLFCKFLQQGENYYPSIKNINYLLTLISQDLKVASNMILKAQLGERKVLFSRIINKLEQTYKKENELIETMNKVLIFE